MKSTHHFSDNSVRLLRLNFGNGGQKTAAMLLLLQLAEIKQKPLKESASSLLSINPFHGCRETRLHSAKAPFKNKNRSVIVFLFITEM